MSAPARPGPEPTPARRGVLAACARAGRRIAGVLATAVDRYFADGCPQHAAGIAYRVLFSIVPLAIVLVAVFGLLLGNRDIHDAVVDTVVRALPPSVASREDVAGAISGIASPSGVVGLITLALFVWAATGMMAAIRTGLELVLGGERGRPAARGKLVDLVLVVGCAVLVLGTVAATVLDRLAQHELRRVDALAGLRTTTAGNSAPRVAAVLASVVIVMLLYRFVPSRRLRRTDALAGAVTTAILLLAISFASGRIYENVNRLSVVYGSLTSALVFLYSVYLYASALLLGAEVAAAWSRPPDPDGGERLRVRIRRAVRGLYMRDPD
ncbi:MAG TPA: YihY/virulence factor BrkB family protein [Gaiellales bacterium]|jgi:membrane protein|nr:YihY/virulence factor BrkB family protein [Gaiellales bacterium]